MSRSCEIALPVSAWMDEVRSEAKAEFFDAEGDMPAVTAMSIWCRRQRSRDFSLSAEVTAADIVLPQITYIAPRIASCGDDI